MTGQTTVVEFLAMRSSNGSSQPKESNFLKINKKSSSRMDYLPLVHSQWESK